MPFEVGQQVSDYEILGVLGAGGMGCVYRVRNKISDRVEAMKVLLPDLTSEPELASRFVSEIRMLAGFFHPNIAQLHTAFQVDNQLVMIMEFIEGMTLAQRVKTSALPLRDVLSYVTQMLAALSYAHERGVIHRDVKPENVMVTPHGIAKLMDFGIAKSNTERLKTQPGTTMGSLYYMSPEQIHGASVDARSDLYSVGITLYELTAGRRPFAGNNTYAILDQQLNAQPQPPIELNPSLPQTLNEIILMAIAKEPMQRFQSAQAFRNALENVRTTLDAPLPPTQSIHDFAGAKLPASGVPGQNFVAPSPAAASRGHRGLWMASGALVVVLVVIAAAITLPNYLRTRAANSSGRQVVPAAQVENAPSPDAQSPALDKPAPAKPEEAPALVASHPDTKTATVDQLQSQRPDRSAAKRSAAAPATLSPPESSASAQPPQPTPPVTANAAQAQPAGPSAAETDQAKERFIQLSARANTVKNSVDQLRQAISADSGAGLRKDMATAYSLMQNYMDEADQAMRANDVQLAQKRMDQAEKQVDKLEAFTSGR